MKIGISLSRPDERTIIGLEPASLGLANGRNRFIQSRRPLSLFITGLTIVIRLSNVSRQKWTELHMSFVITPSMGTSLEER